MHLTLRQRSYLGTFALFLIVLGVIYPFSSYVLRTRFDVFEQGVANKDIERLKLVMDEQLRSLQISVRDYSNWQECLDYVKGHNPTFIKDNYSPVQMRNLDIDLFIIVGLKGNVIASLSVPEFIKKPGDSDLQQTPQAIVQQFVSSPAVLAAVQDTNPHARPMMVNGEWYYVSLSGIRSETTDATPAMGVLIFARRLDARRVGHIQEVSQVKFSLSELPGGATGSRSIATDLKVSDDSLLGRFPALDQDGAATAVVHVSIPRDLKTQFESYRGIILLNIASAIVLSGLLAWFLLEYGVLRRLEKLAGDVDKIRANELKHLDINNNRYDEIDTVAREFNYLIDERNRISGLWRHEALHDSLTGLGNRAALRQGLQELQDQRKPSVLLYAVFLIDIDGFKFVNDIHGHGVGDNLLSTLASRISDSLPPNSLAFRLGGDEFAVLMREARTAKELEVVAGKICEVVRKPVIAADKRLEVSVSIGISECRYGNAELQSGDLLRRADVAMYEVKRRGKNGYALYDETMLDEMTHRTELERDLRVALKNDEIQTWLQPIVDSRTGKPLRMESLCRWKHAHRGWIAADRIIGIAEETLLISDLDLLMLDLSLAALSRMRGIFPELQLSANMSVRTLEMPGFPGKILNALSRAQLPGASLVLEITETALISDNVQVLQAIRELNARGIGFYLDDFGVGYSSLARLAQMSIAGIKLDGSFVRELDKGETRICSAIVHLATQLGMSVTAECVETAKQREMLQKMGCQALQGYLTAPPMPAEEALAWLQKHGS